MQTIVPDWGPYGKELIGCSHLADCKSGHRWDFFLMPGFHRRGVVGPHGLKEASWRVEYCLPDLSAYTLRYYLRSEPEIQVDMEVFGGDNRGRWVRLSAMNGTTLPQSLDLHFAAMLAVNPFAGTQVRLPDDGRWISALDAIRIHQPQHAHRIAQVADSLLPGQVLQPGVADGRCIGPHFLNQPGNALTYKIPALPADKPYWIIIRYHRWTAGAVRIRLSGWVELEVDLPDDGAAISEAVLDVPANRSEPCELTLTILSHAPWIFEGIALVPQGSALPLKFPGRQPAVRAAALWDPVAQRLELSYKGLDAGYVVRLHNDVPVIHRTVIGDDIPSVVSERANDVGRSTWQGRGEGSATMLSVHEWEIGAEQSRTLTLWIGTEDNAEVPPPLGDRRDRAIDLSKREPGDDYAQAMTVLKANTYANVVFPIYRRGEWICHYTPGRCWDSLYTWDSGMIGIGMCADDLRRSMEILNTYLLPEDDPYAAWIEHGTPLPTQIWQAKAIWDHCRDHDWLRQVYPGLRAFYEVIAGRSRNSTTDRFATGLLQTWDYFYNSGGWDDYAAQAILGECPDRRGRCAPCVTTTHAVCAAAILASFSRLLGYDADTVRYEADSTRWTDALEAHAWNEPAGHYAYVEHDHKGEFLGHLAHKSGGDYNEGLDGMCPLLIGTILPQRAAQLLQKLFDPEVIWTPYGFSTVSQRAPYFRTDGYWNGAVWVAHHYFFWRALLDRGLPELAWKIVHALLTWNQQEALACGHSFEMIRIQSGRGAGWPQFSGLSSPLILMHAAYFLPYEMSFGSALMPLSFTWSTDKRSLVARFAGRNPDGATFQICLPDRFYVEAADADEHPLQPIEITPKTIGFRLPPNVCSLILRISPK